jgi:hypothetical protein
MLRRPLLALVAATLVFTACSDDGASTSGSAGDTTGVEPADGAAGDTGTTGTALAGGGGTPSDFCEQIAERPLTNDPADAAEHYARLQDVLPPHLRDEAAVLERAYRDLADQGASASAIDEEGRVRTAVTDLVGYQKAVCFG